MAQNVNANLDLGLAAALVNCGFTNNQVAFLGTQGLTSVAGFNGMPFSAMTELWKSLVKAGQDVANVGVLPYPAGLKFRGLKLWSTSQRAKGIAPNFIQWEDPLMTKWTERVFKLAELEAPKGKTEPKAPTELTSLDDSEAWKLQVHNYLLQFRNNIGTPLTYIIRDHEEVTDAMRAAEYGTIDDEMIACTVLTGSTYAEDTQKVYTLIFGSIIKGPIHTYIKPFRLERDGRAAYKAVITQAEGPSAETNKKQKAYAIIRDTKYTGKNRFTFQQFVDRLQGAYNDLEVAGEPVAETKKVQDMLTACQDTRLTTAIDLILGDPTKNNNFTVAQQYLQSMVNFKRHPTESRNLSAVSSGRGGGRGRGRGRAGGRGKGRSGERKPNHHYSRDEWLAMSEEQRQKARDQRAAYKKKKGDAKAAGTEPARSVNAMTTSFATDELDKKSAALPKTSKVRWGSDVVGEESDTSSVFSSGPTPPTEVASTPKATVVATAPEVPKDPPPCKKHWSDYIDQIPHYNNAKELEMKAFFERQQVNDRNPGMTRENLPIAEQARLKRADGWYEDAQERYAAIRLVVGAEDNRAMVFYLDQAEAANKAYREHHRQGQEYKRRVREHEEEQEEHLKKLGILYESDDPDESDNEATALQFGREAHPKSSPEGEEKEDEKAEATSTDDAKVAPDGAPEAKRARVNPDEV